LVFHQREVPYHGRRRYKWDGWYVFACRGSTSSEPPSAFPQEPTGVLKHHIVEEADARMAYYLPLPEAVEVPPNTEVPERPKLPDGTVDAPLVRLYNFLRERTLFYGSKSPYSHHDHNSHRDDVALVSAPDIVLSGRVPGLDATSENMFINNFLCRLRGCALWDGDSI
jgi:hypothetical protein